MSDGPRYLVSTRVLSPGVVQPLPAGCQLLLIGASFPELLTMSTGEQSTLQTWGVGLTIKTPDDAPFFISTSSATGDTISIAVGQGGVEVGDSATVLMDGLGVRRAARGTDYGSAIGVSTGYKGYGNTLGPLAVGVSANVDLTGLTPFFLTPRRYYTISAHVMVWASIASGWVRVDVQVGARVPLRFNLLCLVGVPVQFTLDNAVFYYDSTNVNDSVAVKVFSYGAFNGEAAGSCSNATLIG